MKRDLALIRKILLALEENESATGLGPVDLEIENYSDAQIGYHLKLLTERELIKATNFTTMGSKHPVYRPSGLTWEGHEFLDAAKNESVWARALEAVAAKGGSLPFAVFQSLLIELSKQQFGL